MKKLLIASGVLNALLLSLILVLSLYARNLAVERGIECELVLDEAQAQLDQVQELSSKVRAEALKLNAEAKKWQRAVADGQASSYPEDYTVKIEKIEHVGVGRFDLVCRMRITEPKNPDEKQVNAAAKQMYRMQWALSKKRGSVTVFIYIDDMPIDMAAYAVGEGSGAEMESFQINEQQYEFWEMIRNQ